MGGCTVLRSIDAQRSEMVDLYPLTGGDDDGRSRQSGAGRRATTTK